MTNIPTWPDRCEVHPDHQSGMVSHRMIQMRMQEEIDDLRGEVSRLEAALTLIADHPVIQSEQWRTGCFEMIRVASKALAGSDFTNPFADR